MAWAQTSSPEEYEVITHWPGQTSKDWGKVPSDICYNASSRATTPASELGSPIPGSPVRPTSTGGEIPSLGFKWYALLTPLCLRRSLRKGPQGFRSPPGGPAENLVDQDPPRSVPAAAYLRQSEAHHAPTREEAGRYSKRLPYRAPRLHTADA